MLRIIKAALSLAAGVALADLIHTTPGPGYVFLKSFAWLDDHKDHPLGLFALEAADCHRCLSFYLTVVFQVLAHFPRLYWIIAPAIVATKVSQAFYLRWSGDDES